MATGIQTGMRTGSRAGLTTGRGAAGKPPGGGGGLGKLKDMWNGLGKGARIGIVSLVALAITGGIVFSTVSSANKDVELYTTKMTAQDVNDCAAKLTELGMSHTVKITGDGIMIHPKLRAKAQAQLAASGLPRHPVLTPNNAPSEGINAKTQAEQKVMRQRLLEGELTEAIRQMDGVADAYVKIAAPEESYFRDDARAVTATVMVKTTPATQFSEKQIEGIVHLVAFSVPELDQKNVKVIDTNGIDLTASIEQSEDGAVPAGKQALLERQKSEELARKAQEQLDQVLGKGRARVAVTAEMDFSQSETQAKTVGGPQDQGTVVVGRQTKVEQYAKDPQGGGSSDTATQVSEDGDDGTQTSIGSAAKDKNSNYSMTVESMKVAHNETTHKTVRKTPEVKRISCSVAVDNLKKDQVDKIAGLVRGAINLDESRGDQLVVESIPFGKTMLSSNDVQAMAAAMGSQPAAGTGVNGGMNAQMVGMMMFGPAVLLLAFFGVFMLKQHRVQVNQSQLVLGSTHSGTTATDIADLTTDKSGRSSAVTETRVNTTDALEKLAKEKPTKVAEMLKSTWLSG